MKGRIEADNIFSQIKPQPREAALSLYFYSRYEDIFNVKLSRDGTYSQVSLEKQKEWKAFACSFKPTGTNTSTVLTLKSHSTFQLKYRTARNKEKKRMQGVGTSAKKTK